METDSQRFIPNTLALSEHFLHPEASVKPRTYASSLFEGRSYVSAHICTGKLGTVPHLMMPAMISASSEASQIMLLQSLLLASLLPWYSKSHSSAQSKENAEGSGWWKS